MPDMFEVKGAAKVRCFGREAALDGLSQPAGTLMGRIAPDEVIFVGQPGTAAALVEDLQGQLAGEGNAALVVDRRALSPKVIDVLRLSDIAAIEFYLGPDDVPPQFAPLSGECGMFVIWTKDVLF